MSIIVSVKIHDGIVLAADSATTFYKQDGTLGQIYEHADKIVNLVKDLPIGVMTCGAGGIGNASIATLLKDLRRLLTGEDETHPDWKVDPKAYTIESIATSISRFFSEKITEDNFKAFLLLRICGYSSGHLLPEVWQVVFDQGKLVNLSCVQMEKDFGPRWNGEEEALDRIILGLGFINVAATVSIGMTREQIGEKLFPHLYEPLILPAAPIQDAIDLSRFMVETTMGFIRFSVARIKTVGGPIEIAAITKHEGFNWVQRKHFYPSKL